ncbi:MAG: hypothetical protein HY053_04855 [Proteobacteria bacterium]|nr:hypothetical protein [Pseudomonadota bacterium]
MSVTEEAPGSPNIRFICYGIDHKGTDRARDAEYIPTFPLDAGEAERLANLEGDEILSLPQGLRDFLKRKPSTSADQIAAVEIKNKGEVIAVFYVNGVRRERADGSISEPNHLLYAVSGEPKTWAPEDEKWITLAQAKTGWGVFEESVHYYSGDGDFCRMEKIVLGPKDKIVRLIGDDLVVIPRKVIKAAMPLSARRLPAAERA